MAVLDTMVGDMRNGDFAGQASAEVAADAPLWFFWTLQQLERHIGAKALWEKYGEAMKSILTAYRRGFFGGCVALHDNGLIWASREGYALTWMNNVENGVPVIRREGYAVEVNALWYNAVSYTLALASKMGDKEFVSVWKGLPALTKKSFVELFAIGGEGWLADYTDGRTQNRSVRCNQIVACGLDYTMLDDEQRVNVLMTVRQHRLRPKGCVRFLRRTRCSSRQYKENPIEREAASRNGAVWVWPLMFYVQCGISLEGARFLPTAKEILANFDENIQYYCIGSIAEYFDPNPPFAPRGAISQASSVGGLLYIKDIIERCEPKPKRRSAKSDAEKRV